MNKKELIDRVCERLKENNCRKSVAIPKRVFHISDGDGNRCNFNVKEVGKSVAYTQADIADITNAFIEIIEDSLKNGEEISVYGFGTLAPHFRAARNTKIPGTDERVEVDARYVPKFSPGNRLRLAVKLWELSHKDGGK